MRRTLQTFPSGRNPNDSFDVAVGIRRLLKGRRKLSFHLGAAEISERSRFDGVQSNTGHERRATLGFQVFAAGATDGKLVELSFAEIEADSLGRAKSSP